MEQVPAHPRPETLLDAAGGQSTKQRTVQPWVHLAAGVWVMSMHPAEGARGELVEAGLESRSQDVEWRGQDGSCQASGSVEA